MEHRLDSRTPAQSERAEASITLGANVNLNLAVGLYDF